MNSSHILVIDDDQDIRNLVKIYLKNEGYSVETAENGLEALKKLEETDFDCIILDIMMPKMDGIQACISIRESKNTPIIMLSAKGEDMDKITGLSIGADDYVTKPFNPLELIARVKSQLRRYKKLNSSPTAKRNEAIEIGELMIDIDKHQVTRSGQEISLTPTEFSILALLVKNRGKVFSSEAIYEKVWKESHFESDNTVMVHIRKIREKIEAVPRKPQLLKTVWGVGYKFDE